MRVLLSAFLAFSTSVFSAKCINNSNIETFIETCLESSKISKNKVEKKIYYNRKVFVSQPVDEWVNASYDYFETDWVEYQITSYDLNNKNHDFALDLDENRSRPLTYEELDFTHIGLDLLKKSREIDIFQFKEFVKYSVNTVDKPEVYLIKGLSDIDIIVKKLNDPNDLKNKDRFYVSLIHIH